MPIFAHFRRVNWGCLLILGVTALLWWGIVEGIAVYLDSRYDSVTADTVSACSHP